MVSASALWLPRGNRDHISDPSLSPHWRFWGTFLWSVLIFILLCISQLLVTIIQIKLSSQVIYSRFQVEAALQFATDNGNAVAYSIFASTIVVCSLIGGIIKLKRGATLKDYLCLYEIPAQTTALWFGITSIYVLGSSAIQYLLGRPIIPRWSFDVYTSAQPVWMLWVAVVIAAPLSEEMFIRGFMFRGLQSSFLGLPGTIVITSVLWAVLHIQYDFYVVVDIGCFGILLATARQMTGSLLVPLYLHSFINFCATVQVAVLQYLR